MALGERQRWAVLAAERAAERDRCTHWAMVPTGQSTSDGDLLWRCLVPRGCRGAVTPAAAAAALLADEARSATTAEPDPPAPPGPPAHRRTPSGRRTAARLACRAEAEQIAAAAAARSRR